MYFCNSFCEVFFDVYVVLNFYILADYKFNEVNVNLVLVLSRDY